MMVIPQSNLDIEFVVSALKSGQTIVYPTETCYGLGCDARNGEAVEKVVKIKQRRESKPMLVIVPDAAMALRYLEWSLKLQELADKYWPGALTVVGRLKDWKIERLPRLADGVVAGDGTVAFRVTSHPIPAQLSRLLDAPLVSTSANISGKEPSYSAEGVIKMFENQPDQPDILLDYGVLPRNPPTTIVRVMGGEMEVLRKGNV